jgi:hypothetical protein
LRGWPPHCWATDEELVEIGRGLLLREEGKRRVQRRDAGEPPVSDTPDHGLACIFGD